MGKKKGKDRDEMDAPSDKHWARQYLLDPLTDPEPHQEDGPGTSFINPDPSLRTTSNWTDDQGNRSSFGATKRQPHLPTVANRASPGPTAATVFPSPPPSSWPRQHMPLFLDIQDTSTNPQLIRRKPLPRMGPDSPHDRLPPIIRVPRNPAPDHATGISARHSWPTNTDARTSLRRHQFLSQRFPGDMSHRPLHTLSQEHRTADRARHLRTPRRVPEVDLIDSLDTVGGTYHHGGPYDATLASRNRNKMYAPMEAVHDSNRAALEATPREYVQDSLQKRVPLQGTSTVPSGSRDLSGKVMNYEEGVDLMREPEAGGGAYKRWPGFQYHPDDLKGKGEPSYTYEKDLKKKKRARRSRGAGGSPGDIEMQPGVNRKENFSTARQRSTSDTANDRLSPPQQQYGGEAFSNNYDIRRANSTGKRLSDGIKRRFGSFRRRNVEATA